MRAFLQFAAVAFLMFEIRDVRGFANGPPISTCLTLFPKHRAEQQMGEAPYRLTFSNATYSPGQTITLSVSSNETGRTFVGFQVTAHRVAGSGNDQQFVGNFNATDDSGKTVDCLGSLQSMWGHNNNSTKIEVTATWTAPDVNVGGLQFFLTVVEDYQMFWHRIPFSLPAETSTNVVAPQPTVPALEVTSAQKPDWSGCSKTKACWFVPAPGSTGCNGADDCLAILSYRKQDDQFLMEMSIKGQDRYVAVGFSNDRLMGGEPVILCTANTGHESIQQGYNPGLHLDRQFTTGVSGLVAGYVDGSSYCTFTSQTVLSSITSEGTKEFDLNNKYYLFLAWGHIYLGTDVAGKHHDLPAISSEKVDLSQFTSPTSAASANTVTFSVLVLAIVFVFYN